MRRIWNALPVAAASTLLVCGAAMAQVAPTQTNPQATTNASRPNGIIAPRTPGNTGALGGNQGRMSATVGGINNHLLNAEKDRPRLPNQAPSPSQTLPGGTASGQTPR